MPALSTSHAGLRRIRLLGLGLVLAALAGLGGCAGASVRWNFDYNQASRQAEQQGRPVLLYFWDWLSVDRSRMESEVFNDPRVVAEMRRTINVPLEQGWFPDLVRKYDVTSVPTLILLAPEGIEQARLQGVPTPEEFLNWLRSALAQPVTTQPIATRVGPGTA